MFYISLEMAEELLAERVLANLCNVPIFDIVDSSVEDLTKLLDNNFKNREKGKFFFRRLPTSTNPDDIERCVNEILLTKGIVIDLVVVDYLGIMKPKKRAGVDTNSLYSIGKDVIEQLRDMADRTNTAVLTASQTNRDGYDELMASLKNTAGSAGINETADLIVTIARDVNLRSMGMFFHMILKNRFGENGAVFHSTFVKEFMRVVDATAESVSNYHQTLTAKQVNIKDFTRVSTGNVTLSGKSDSERQAQELAYAEKYGNTPVPVEIPQQQWPLNPEIMGSEWSQVESFDIGTANSQGPIAETVVAEMPNNTVAQMAADFLRRFG